MIWQQLTIAVATDGSTKPKQGSIVFFIVQVYDREYYFQSYSQPAGIKTQSFWSEVCSILAAVTNKNLKFTLTVTVWSKSLPLWINTGSFKKGH